MLNYIKDPKIYKQVCGVLINQTHKDVTTTLSQRIGHIIQQIDKTSELIKKN
jgi:chaperonin cofactor prefoldin